MTYRIVLAWFWVLRVTRLHLVLNSLIEAHITKLLGRPALPPPKKEPVQAGMTRVEYDFIVGADCFRTYDGKYVSIANGRCVREQ